MNKLKRIRTDAHEVNSYKGANINAQTEETQETALTLACCGGFLEVADFLIKAGADIELGASTDRKSVV